MEWLMEGDPSIQYQTKRDLLTTPSEELLQSRNTILHEGWGKALIDLQDEDGTWSHTLYSPKWISTFYSMLLLKRMGAPAVESTIKGAQLLLDKGFYELDGGINYWKSWKTGECCVTGMLLSMLCHFGIKDSRLEKMVNYLLTEQMSDGGWNCERPNGAIHSSFHTTISVLEGLWEYEKVSAEESLIKLSAQARARAVEFLLKHQLYKSHKTGETVDARMAKLIFPHRWYFNYLRCLDYFRDSSTEKDDRMAEAIERLKSRRLPNGLWKLEGFYRNKVYFQMEKVGKESRWTTLMALRILSWWNHET